MTPDILFLAAALATVAGPAGGQQPTATPTRPSPSTPDGPTPDGRPATAIPAKVTVEGCVATEAEIPNRKTDLGERTGLDKHFVLVNGTVVKGKAPVTPPASGDGVVSTALAPMFQLHGLTDEQLKLHVGHRVRIDGHFANVDAATEPNASGKELARLDVATIRQVPGDCSVPKS
jgi:hypothetical protein